MTYDTSPEDRPETGDFGLSNNGCVLLKGTLLCRGFTLYIIQTPQPLIEVEVSKLWFKSFVESGGYAWVYSPSIRMVARRARVLYSLNVGDYNPAVRSLEDCADVPQELLPRAILKRYKSRYGEEQ